MPSNFAKLSVWKLSVKVAVANTGNKVGPILDNLYLHNNEPISVLQSAKGRSSDSVYSTEAPN